MIWKIEHAKPLAEIIKMNTPVDPYIKQLFAQKMLPAITNYLQIKHQDRETTGGQGPERIYQAEIVIMAKSQADHIESMLEMLKLHCHPAGHDMINTIKDEIKYR